jgi:Cu(I)-responsive transcriptional regulator
MNIGEASAASGVTAKMIRYYESIGLIGPAARSQGNYRVYGHEDVHTLRFIRRARSLGFSIEETEQLLSLWRDKGRASAEVKAIATSHIADLNRKITELKEMTATLGQLVASCHGDDRPHCPILNELAAEGAGHAHRHHPPPAARGKTPGRRGETRGKSD